MKKIFLIFILLSVTSCKNIPDFTLIDVPLDEARIKDEEYVGEYGDFSTSKKPILIIKKIDDKFEITHKSGIYTNVYICKKDKIKYGTIFSDGKNEKLYLDCKKIDKPDAYFKNPYIMLVQTGWKYDPIHIDIHYFGKENYEEYNCEHEQNKNCPMHSGGYYPIKKRD
ncbi:MAG: hypothetical protein LBR35_00390 [Rickettsiales bacterium]|jgi:hypothetical protein|nr:hypothetical protein [Rickettsiales bacterium]